MNNISTAIGIKEDCLRRITQIVNEQIILMDLAKSEYMKYKQFKEKFDNLEEEKEALVSIKADCDLIILSYYH